MRQLTDPRPDLQSDHDLWQGVLSKAGSYEDTDAVYWALDGLRCLGARLGSRPGSGLRFEPGEMDPAEFQATCNRYLLPHLAVLKAVLRDAAPPERPIEDVGCSAEGVRVAA